MKANVLLCEAGIIILNEVMDIVSVRRFQSTSRTKAFCLIEDGQMIPDLLDALKEASDMGFDEFGVSQNLLKVFSKSGFSTSALDDRTLGDLQSQKIDLMVGSRLVTSHNEARELVREFAITLSEDRLREHAAKPDLQAMEAVQALDELDKILNLLSARLREWYGLHFPELTSLVDDTTTYAKMISKFGKRESFLVEDLKPFGLPEKRAEAVIIAARNSKGGDIRNEDLSRISSLAQETLNLSTIRERMAEHIEKTMAEIAPNITSVAGATIGARLIARAGGLEKMARLPSSTIQILGAEKALFRALKMGTRPPKHGVIFQHADVHTAPKWQRGKIARSLAAKIAIASRVDAFRGEKEGDLENKFKKRLEEIRTKYAEPPKMERIETREKARSIKYGQQPRWGKERSAKPRQRKRKSWRRRGSSQG